MKQFLLLITFFSLFNIILPSSLVLGFSPNGTIKLFVEDSKGRIDSVTFGIKDLSTVGIDETLGENNIYGTPNDSLDIRVIQRDSLHHNCSYYDIFHQPPKGDMFYPENIDTKLDYRPYDDDKYLQNINMNFEIKVNAVDFPVIVKADLKNFINSFYVDWTSIFLVDTNCNYQKEVIFPNIIKMDPIYIIYDNSIQTLVIKFFHESSVKDYNTIEPTWEIFPNPANRQ